MNNKYGRREEKITKPCDTQGWKRICAIDTFCKERYADKEKITLKEAYEDNRTTKPTMISHKLLWNNKQRGAIKIFLWKLLNGALPTSDNLTKFIAIQPTIWPICKQNEDTQQHIFLKCPATKAIWTYYANILNGPTPKNQHIRQYLLEWWMQVSEKTMEGKLMQIVPGIILWNIWKEYNKTTKEEKLWNQEKTQEKIKEEIKEWCLMLNDTKKACNSQPLIEAGITPRLQTKTTKILKWELPPTGKLKINTDAAIGDRCAA